jgi:benzodiazapine receptor
LYEREMKLLCLLFVVLLAIVCATPAAAKRLDARLTPSAKLTRKITPPQIIPGNLSNTWNLPRGGSKGASNKGPVCSDSNQELLVKTAILAALESAGLLLVIAGSGYLAPTVSEWMQKLNLPSSINELAIIQWIALVFVIFSSSTMKTWIQGGVSTATNQALNPNVVPGDQAWYANLKKPWFNPPGWVFPIMWLIVSKPTQLVAASKILKSDVSNKYWPVLAVYCAHLSLGDAWNEVFFGCQRIGLGAVVICTFFGLLVTSAALFYNVDEMAGKFMLPTCAWVFVATALNLSIYIQNKPE